MDEDDSQFERPLLERLRHVFGEPDPDVGRFHHWSVQSQRSTLPLHILVNMTEPCRAEVWLFDPADTVEGVTRETITQARDIEPVISKIRWHLRAADQG